MSDLPSCVCESPFDCANCEPNCEGEGEGERNRWYTMLGALNGSYDNFGCERRERTAANGATYDEGYSIPFYALTPTTSQRVDGLIDAYADRIQFGLATFDGEFTYQGGADLIPLRTWNFAASDGTAGLFSYGGASTSGPRLRPDGTEVGRLFYPGTSEPYYVDSGIRSASATEGALSLPSLDLSPSERSSQLQLQLQRVRPYGGSPIAASLDDLYVFFTEDPLSRSSAPDAKRHVIVVTDGAPDPDFRDLNCDCSTPPNVCPAAVDPATLSCPYPRLADAVRHLRCGFGAVCDGPVERVHLVGLNQADPTARGDVEAIAAAGGTSARFADDEAQLRAAFGEVLADILADE